MSVDATILAIGVSSDEVPIATNRLDRLTDSAKRTEDATDRMAESHKRAVSSGTAIGVAISAATVAIVAATTAAIGYLDMLDEMAEKSGVTATNLAGLGFAAAQSDTDLRKLAELMGRLSDKAADAAAGSLKAGAAFKAMGVNVKDSSGALKGQDQLLLDIAEKFKGYADGTAKAALAQEIFGRGGRELIPLLNRGRDGIEELSAKYRELTGNIDDTARMASDFNNSLASGKASLMAYTVQFTSGLLPALMQIISAWQGATASGDAFKSAGQGIGDLLVWLSEKAQMFGATLVAAGKLVGATAAAAVQLLSGNFAAARSIMSEVINDVDALDKKVRTSIANAAALRKQIDAGMSGPATFDARDMQAQANKIAAPIVEAEKKIKVARQSINKELAKLADDFNKLIDELSDLTAAEKKYAAVVREIESLFASGGFGQGQQAELVRVEMLTLAYEKFNPQLIEWRRNLEESAKVREQSLAAQANSIAAIENEAEKIREHTATLGLSKEAIESRAEAILGATIALKQSTLAELRSRDETSESIALIEREIAALRELRAARGEAAAKEASISSAETSRKAIEEQQRAYDDMIESVSRGFGDFLTDFSKNGTDAFKKLWDSFKEWGLRALAQIAAQKIVVGLMGDAGAMGGAAGMMGGGSGGGFGGFGSAFGNPYGQGFSLSDNSWAVGAQTGTWTDTASNAAGGAAMGAGVGMVASAAFGNERNSSSMEMGATIGGAIGSIWGPIGTLIGAALGAAIGSLIKSGGGPKTGGFASEGNISGIGNADSSGRWFTPNEQDSAVTKTLDVINKGYQDFARALGLERRDVGYALGYDTDPEGTAPNRTHAGAFVDGVQVYDSAQGDLGRDASKLQAQLELESKRIMFAALKASLGDAPEYIKQLFESIDTATASASDIDDVLGLATALKELSAAIGPLADKILALNVEDLRDLAAGMGGIDEFSKQMQFFAANFGTTASRVQAVRDSLMEGFAELEIAVPANHQAFAELLDSFDLTTEAGREMYAAVMALAPAFVTLNGSMDQALQVVRQLGEFLYENFITGDMKQSDEIAQLNTMFASLNVAVPRTHAEFLKLLPTLGLTTQQSAELSAAYVRVNGTAQEWLDTLKGAQSFFASNFYSEGEQAAAALEANWSVVRAAWVDMGEQLQELGYSAIPATVDGFRAMIETLREQGFGDLADQLLLIAPAIIGIRDATQELGASAEDTAASIDAMNEALSRAQALAGTVATGLAKINEAIDALVSGSSGDFGDKLALRVKLNMEQLSNLDDLIAAEQQGESPYGPVIQEYKKTREQLAAQLGAVSADLARYTVLRAQYNAQIAGQLVELEKWYKEMLVTLAGSPEALAALKIQFDEKWKAIIEGTAGAVDGALSELERLQKGIREYLDNLLLGDLSPLTPRAKLSESEAQFQEQLAAAQGGDLDALGGITQAADAYLTQARAFYASSAQYTTIFDQVTQALSALAATTTPTVADANNAALNAALPANGQRMASKEDIEALATKFVDAIAALADANSEDAEVIVTGLKAPAMSETVRK